MGATSVTGRGSPEHQTLGVSHLIGPRWNEDKEKELAGLKKSVTRLWLFNLFTNLAFFFMAIAYYLITLTK